MWNGSGYEAKGQANPVWCLYSFWSHLFPVNTTCRVLMTTTWSPMSTVCVCVWGGGGLNNILVSCKREGRGGGRYVTCRVVHWFRLSLEEEGHHGRQSPYHLSPSVNQVPQPCAGCKTLCVCVWGGGGGDNDKGELQ